ncbi:MAG: hypothetical protein AAF902_24835, partial [Chloroflexota bacterium]
LLTKVMKMVNGLSIANQDQRKSKALMLNCVFTNLGNRDITLNGKPIVTREKPARVIGKEVWDQIEAGAADPFPLDQIEFPILEPQLNHIANNYGEIGGLYLFDTDQADSTFNRGDTLYFAKIIQALLPRRFEKGLMGIQVISVKENPTRYDQMMTFFEEKIVGVKDELAHQGIKTQAHVLASAGVPACTTALLFQAVRFFKDDATVHYLPEGNHPAATLHLGQQLQNAFLKETIHTLLKRFDFAGVCEVIEKIEDRAKAVEPLLNYGKARLIFDFDTAYNYLQKAVSLNNKVALIPKFEEVGANFERLCSHYENKDLDEHKKAQIAELFYNARIARDNGRAIDFLGRVVRFIDAVLSYLSKQSATRQYLLERLAKQDAYQGSSWEQTHFIQLAYIMDEGFDVNDLMSILFDMSIDKDIFSGIIGKKMLIQEIVQYCNRRGLLDSLVQTLKEENGRNDLWEQLEVAKDEIDIRSIYPRLARLEMLRKLRDDSILINGFGGASREIIDQTYERGHDPAEDMAAVCIALQISTVNPYRVACGLICELLQINHSFFSIVE